MNAPTLKTWTLINACLLAAVWLAERCIGETFWPTMLLVYSPQAVWLILPVMLVIAGLTGKQWGSAGVNALLLLAAAFWLVNFQVHLPAPAGEAGRVVQVLTWNLHLNEGAAALPAMVERSGAEVVFIQEADAWDEEGLAPMLRDPRLAGWHVVRGGDVAILSKYPLTRVAGFDDRSVIADCLVDGRRLRLITAHPYKLYGRWLFSMSAPSLLYASDASRHRLFDLLLQNIPPDEPVILGGDFNTPPNSALYRRIAGRLTDAFAQCGTGFGFTFAANFPLIRIDYVFAGNGCRPVSIAILRDPHSDHKAVTASIELPSVMRAGQ